MAIRLSNGVMLLEDLGYETFYPSLSESNDDSVWTSPDFFDYLNLHPSKKTSLMFSIVGEERIYDLFFDGGSSIESPHSDIPQTSSAIFDLYGRRMTGSPKKGIYIQNGKKIIR